MFFLNLHIFNGPMIFFCPTIFFVCVYFKRIGCIREMQTDKKGNNFMVYWLSGKITDN